MDYRILKLHNGDDLIALIEGETDLYYQAHNPWQLTKVPVGLQASDAYLTFAEWIPYTNEKDYKIKKCDVLAAVSCKEEIIQFYLDLLESKNSKVSFKTFRDVLNEIEELEKDPKEDYMDILKNLDNSTKH
jgi:hypothetical protein